MKNLFLQIAKFVGFSGIGWLLDFAVYNLLNLFIPNVVVNNYISSWVGLTFVFIFSTRKIFKNKGRISLVWKYLIYVVYQAVLIFLISLLLGFISSKLELVNIELISRFAKLISKILVTPVTMCCNFIVMKNVIEKI